MRSITVKNSETLTAKRDDARVFLPRAFSPEKYGHVSWSPLSKFAVTSSSTLTASRKPDDVFNYFDLKDVDGVEGEIVSIHQVKGENIKGGKRLVRGGDIIFARIEPSIFNRKYAIVPSGIGACLTSTEFFVARPKYGVNSLYLHWALRGQWVAEQLSPGILTGSTGRRRLKIDDFQNLLIPDVSVEIQAEIGTQVANARSRRKELLSMADNVIQETDNNMLLFLYDAKSYSDPDEFEKVALLPEDK